MDQHPNLGAAEPAAPPAPSCAAPGGDAHPGAGRGRLPLMMLWAVALAVVLLDQATKAWALASLETGERVALLGRLLGLVLVRNPGAAFSIASGQTWVFSLIAIIVTAVILRVSRRLVSRSWAVALGLVLGGAVGNLIDRLVRSPGVLRGHVIDFIDYAGYFVGNVADIAIVAAALGIIVLSLGGWEMDGTRSTGKEAAGARASGSTAPGPRRRARLRALDGGGGEGGQGGQGDAEDGQGGQHGDQAAGTPQEAPQEAEGRGR